MMLDVGDDNNVGFADIPLKIDKITQLKKPQSTGAERVRRAGQVCGEANRTPVTMSFFF